MNVRTVALSLLACAALSPAVVSAQECLHGTNSAPEQVERRKAALAAARQVNTLQANGSATRGGKYLNRVEMADAYAEQLKKRPAAKPLTFDRNAEMLPGWQLTFDRTDTGYWFMIKDKTDPCGFAYISNENGVIFTAQPIR